MLEITFHVVLVVMTWQRSPFILHRHHDGDHLSRWYGDSWWRWDYCPAGDLWRRTPFMLVRWLLREITFHVGPVTHDEGDGVCAELFEADMGNVCAATQEICVQQQLCFWHAAIQKPCKGKYFFFLKPLLALLLTCSCPKALQSKTLFILEAALTSASVVQLSKSPAKQNTFYFGSRSHDLVF